jgi:hypothetical protein
VGASGGVRRRLAELSLERFEESLEEIEDEGIGSRHDVAELVLNERAEDDGLLAIRPGYGVDRLDGFPRLVGAFPSVSDVTPVWSEMKKTVRGLMSFATPRGIR